MSNARLNNGGEVAKFLKRIEKIYKPTTSPTLDTASTALVAGDDEILPTTLASWATGDWFILEGSGGWEFGQLGVKPGSGAIPLVRPLVFSHDTGATMTKATRKDLGYIENAGANVSASTSPNGLGAANARGNIAILDGEPAEPSFSFKLRE